MEQGIWMKVFQEMSVRIDDNHERTADNITKALPQRWRRDKGREERVGRSTLSRIYAFVLSKESSDYALLVMREDQMALAVANVVPLQDSEFSTDEYNDVVADFARVLGENHFEVQIGKAEVELADLIGELCAQKLRIFSDCANKSTGHAHPSDDSRWLEWVYSMTRSHRTIDFEALVYFLGEQGWDEESAHQLALDYSYGSRAMEYALEQIRQVRR
jgi:hypothetical protein